MLHIPATKQQLLGWWLVLVAFKQLFNSHFSTQMDGLLTLSKASAMDAKEYMCSSSLMVRFQIFDMNEVQVYSVIHSKFHYCHGCALN